MSLLNCIVRKKREMFAFFGVYLFGLGSRVAGLV